jgi:ubiquinone/menaquinone biosynthesis C-methylase UbiE
MALGNLSETAADREDDRPMPPGQSPVSQSHSPQGGSQRNQGDPGRSKTWDGHIHDVQQLADSPGFLQLRDEIITAAHLALDDRVLDVGAGTGLLTLAAAPRVAHVTAIDISPAMCRHLEGEFDRRSIKNADVIVASAHDLPLEDGSFDVVLSNYCFHHLTDPDKRRALSEAMRVLRPNGRLVFGDMMFRVGLSQPRDRQVIGRFTVEMLRRGPAGVVRLAKNAARHMAGRGEHPAGIDWWRQELQQAGFSEVELRAMHHEGGIASARRPEDRPRGSTGGSPDGVSSVSSWGSTSG